MMMACASFALLNGEADNQRGDLGYYYAITGGKFPNGQTVNGDNASGGTFRFFLDAAYWGYPLGQWHKDDWFPENAGLALTMKYVGSTVYDNFNNEAGDFYTCPPGQASGSTPGLYRGYCMSNNYDWIYAGYFKISVPTTIDQITGYFDEYAGFDADSALIGYRMNIWTNLEGDLLPAVASFAGDIFSSDCTSGYFSWGDTGVDRVFGADLGYPPDDILYLTYTLTTPITLPPGEYWFSHDAVVSSCIPVSIVTMTEGPLLVPVDTLVLFEATIADGCGQVDAVWSFGDDSPELLQYDIANPVEATHTYASSGIYTVVLTVSDDSCPVADLEAIEVVVYDPTGGSGFVTGGGWIDSPAGAYEPDPSLTGKATFGFISKYKKGATVPTGNTEFQFKAGDLNFHSGSYQWLVVNQAGTNAQFKGSGTINGEGDFKFMLWAGEGDPDTFRIKIWADPDEDDPVYDNGSKQPIGGGNIIVRTK